MKRREKRATRIIPRVKDRSAMDAVRRRAKAEKGRREKEEARREAEEAELNAQREANAVQARKNVVVGESVQFDLQDGSDPYHSGHVIEISGKTIVLGLDNPPPPDRKFENIIEISKDQIMANFRAAKKFDPGLQKKDNETDLEFEVRIKREEEKAQKEKSKRQAKERAEADAKEKAEYEKRVKADEKSRKKAEKEAKAKNKAIADEKARIRDEQIASQKASAKAEEKLRKEIEAHEKKLAKKSKKSFDLATIQNALQVEDWVEYRDGSKKKHGKIKHIAGSQLVLTDGVDILDEWLIPKGAVIKVIEPKVEEHEGDDNADESSEDTKSDPSGEVSGKADPSGSKKLGEESGDSQKKDN